MFITGERGVGKRHMALTIAASGELAPVVVEAGDAAQAGLQRWMEQFLGILDKLPEGSVVVVARIERLDPAVLVDIAELISTRAMTSFATAVRPEPRTAAHHPLDHVTVFGDRVHIPPLRHRPEDVGRLARYFDIRHGTGGLTWTTEALELMELYQWPGNVRELEHTVQWLLERLSATAVVEPEHLPDDLLRRVRRRPRTRLEEAEVDIMLAALTEANGNKDLAAQLIGIHRATLYRKLQNYGLDGPSDS